MHISKAVMLLFLVIFIWDSFAFVRTSDKAAMILKMTAELLTSALSSPANTESVVKLQRLLRVGLYEDITWQ